MQKHSGMDQYTVLFIGAYGLTAQVVLIRELYSLFAGTEILLGFAMAGWLLWVGAGSALAGRLFLEKRLPALGPLSAWSAAVLVSTIVILRMSSGLLIPVPGEIAVITKVIAVSTAVMMPCGVLAGVLFSAAAARLASAGISGYSAGERIYSLESVGGAAAGLALGMFLFGWMGTLRAAFLLAAVSASLPIRSALQTDFRRNQSKFWRFLLPALPVLLFFAAWNPLGRLDYKLESIRYGAFELKYMDESPYGRIEEIEHEEQKTLLVNGVVSGSSPDKASAEERIHLALGANRQAVKVLLMGGGLGDVSRELSGYKAARITYVEIDKAVLAAAIKNGLFLNPGNIKVRIDDPRRFLKREPGGYDAVIIGAGEPHSLKLNRLYSIECFNNIYDKLASNGILALEFSGSENYYTYYEELFLSCILKTLTEVFPKVLLLPGGRFHLIAFKNPASALTPRELGDVIAASKPDLTCLTPKTMKYRFSESRMAETERIASLSGSAKINGDFSFEGFIYGLVRWNEKMGLNIPRWLMRLFLDRKKVFISSIIVLLLGFFVPVLARAGSNSAAALGSVYITGLSSMGGTIALLVAFQILCGALYQWIAVLSSGFMAGAALGSFLTAKRLTERSLKGRFSDSSGPGRVHAAFVVYFLFAVIFIKASRGIGIENLWMKPTLVLLQIFLGFISGAGYVKACALKGEGKETAPLVYAFDMAGAIAGAAVFAGAVLPLLGLYYSLAALAFLNAAALALLYSFNVYGFRPDFLRRIRQR